MIFGASITYGAWDKEGGWAQRLRKFLDERALPDLDSYYLTYNLGISGDKTEELLERFEFEAEQRIDEDAENIFIFSIGINDSQFVRSQNGHRVPPEKFRKNIQKLIELAKKFSLKIVFVGLTPVDETKTLSWMEHKSYKNEYIKKYDQIVKAVCKEKKIKFIGVLNEFGKGDYKSLLQDGLHPNTRGHQKIFGIIKNFLVKNKII